MLSLASSPLLLLSLLILPLLTSSLPLEQEAAPGLAREARQAGGDVPNGCHPNTAIGGFLLFAKFRAICAEKGFPEAGAYGK